MRLERQDFRDLVTQCRKLNAEISKTMMERVSRIADDGRYAPGDGHGDRPSPRRRVLSAP